MFLNLFQSAGWINRYRYSTCHKDSEESEEILPSGGEHDKNRLAGSQSVMLESRGNTFRFIPQFKIGNDFIFFLVTVKTNMGTVRVFFSMPLKNLDQCFSLQWSLFNFTQLYGANFPGYGETFASPGA